MRRRSIAIPLMAAAILLTTGVTPAEALNAHRHFIAGAAGIGDPYYPLYGNGGYDVQNYELRLDYDPTTDNLVGVATISARATDDLYQFNLDLQGLTVRSITVNGDPASWNRAEDHELVVTPRHKLRNRTPLTVVVRYDGVPRTQLLTGTDDESGFMHTDDGAIVAGAPEVAANWFPANDHPLDKATFTFVVTVPAGLQVIANGQLVGRATTRTTTTWKWAATEPMAPYLASINIGHFTVHAYKIRGGLQMYDAIDPDLFSEAVNPSDPESATFGRVAQVALSHQPQIIDFLASTFGPYPFSAGGGVVDDYSNLFFAMENQTRPLYPKYYFTDNLNGDSLVVHEVAHQWYGDSVAVARWQDVWLNEGFATYAQWLWSAHQGLATEQEYFDFFYNVFPAADPFWAIVVADPGAEHLFDGPSYFRGAMTLHMLRMEIGDAAFFKILRAWAARKAGGNGTTEQFIALAERISGQDLDNVFGPWLYTPTRPELSVNNGAVASAEGATLRPPPPGAEFELAHMHRQPR